MSIDHSPAPRPRLGLAVGDPVGIGPELAVKLLADAADGQETTEGE